MEIVQAVSQLVSNVGFPIACVIAMFYMWNKEREAHQEESRRFIDALNNNTNVMNDIKIMMERMNDNV